MVKASKNPLCLTQYRLSLHLNLFILMGTSTLLYIQLFTQLQEKDSENIIQVLYIQQSWTKWLLKHLKSMEIKIGKKRLLKTFEIQVLLIQLLTKLRSKKLLKTFEINGGNWLAFLSKKQQYVWLRNGNLNGFQYIKPNVTYLPVGVNECVLS